jgi:DNA-binding MarR family transcriptional regulator
MDDSKEHLRFDSPAQEVYLNLWRTYDCLKSLEEKLFDQVELSAQQYNALRLLKSSSPNTLQTSELGKRLISRSPDMTRMLDRLEKRELVERKRNLQNRRVVDVAITHQGLHLLEDLAEKVRQLHQQQLGHLGIEQLAELTKLLIEARKPHDDQSCAWLEHKLGG